MPVNKKAKSAKPASKTAKNESGTSSMQKQIVEIRNSAVAMFNILNKKGIMNEKEFMDEYKKLSAKKK